VVIKSADKLRSIITGFNYHIALIGRLCVAKRQFDVGITP